MDKNLLDIEDLFKKGLEDNEEMPSENTWDRIDKILDKDKVISIHKKYTRLKWVAILSLFFLVGVSMYVWNSRENNKPEKQNRIVLKNEKQPKNNNIVPSYRDSQVDFKKQVDSLNATAYDNQNPIKGIVDTKIDKIILKKQIEEKQLKSALTKSISNLPVSKDGKKSKEKINPDISKKKKEKENNLNKGFIIKTPNHIEYNIDVATRTDNIDSNKILLPLIRLHSLPFTGLKMSTSGLIDTKKILNVIVLAETNATINKSKSISKNKFMKFKNPTPFSITGFYSRDISFFHLQNNPSGNPNTNGIADENGEIETSAYTFGALIDFKPGRHWSLQSGLTLSTTHIDIKFEDEPLYAKVDNSGNVKYRVNTVLGYGYILPSFSNNPNVGDSISSLSAKSTLQYLGIPLAVKYSFDKGKFSINAMVGISGNFLTKGKMETEVELGNDHEIETVDKIYGLKKFYMSGLAGVGVDYNFYKNLSISFSPTLRFALNPINKNTPVISYPNSLEFSLGLKVKF